MPEYSTVDGDHPSGVPTGGVPAARPDDWVAPGVVPFGVIAATQALTLTYTVTLQDMAASVLEHPATRKKYEAVVSKAAWRRGLRTMPITLGLVLLANLFLLNLDVTWSVLSTLVLAGLLVLVQWSQVDHAAKRSLPAAVQKLGLAELAKRGDQRRIDADAAGVTLSDAASRLRFGWDRVQLSETDGYILLTIDAASWAIPKRLGQPLADLVRFARSHGAG